MANVAEAFEDTEAEDQEAEGMAKADLDVASLGEQETEAKLAAEGEVVEDHLEPADSLVSPPLALSCNPSGCQSERQRWRPTGSCKPPESYIP